MTTAPLPSPSRLVRMRHLPDDGEPSLAPVAPWAGQDPPPRQRSPTREAGDVRSRVLHVGCGRQGPGRLHGLFSGPAWREVRVDVDPAVEPDIVASLVDLRAVASASAQALWCSHSLEHLCAHEVAPALREFRRVLAPDGFALIRSPDMDAVIDMAAEKGLDHLVYHSPAGPVTVLDMIYGHAGSIARGNPFMRHGTAFTTTRLARVLDEAGFATARTGTTTDYTVWAVAFMPDADVGRVLRALGQRGVKLAARSPTRHAA